MSIQMRTNTKKFKVLKFIGAQHGVKYMDIERFICELNGYDYDLKVESRQWNYKTNKIKTVMIRRHKGIWATNLTCGKKSILRQYCMKNENNLWVLNPETKQWIDSINKVPVSSLESVTADDTIKGNSVPLSIQRYRIEPNINAVKPTPVKTEKEKLQDIISTVLELKKRKQIIKNQVDLLNRELEKLSAQIKSESKPLLNFLEG